jgi:DNA primase catalytic core
MPRIPDDELARLKAIPLLDLCRDYGIELRQEGKDWKGRCPFHDDRTPSFVVTPSKNLWNCLGACGCGGDTIQLVMRKEGVSFRHACEKLRARLGAVPGVPTITTRLGTAHEILCTPEEARDDAGLLGKAAEFYHRTFLNEPAAMKYLQGRACFHPEAATAFRLGFANRTLGYRVPPQETAVGRELKARLQALGVLRKETGHEHLSGCVVFPIQDTAGRIVQLYGRRLNAVGEQARHLYLAGPQRGVWNQAALLPGGEWLVGEALIDALTLWCHGWRNVTASYGVNGWTDEHTALVAERKPGRLVVCYDADPAGHTRTEALTKIVAALGVAVWRAAPPEGQDINDVARAAKDPAAALRAVLDGAKKLAGPVVVPVAKPEAAPSVDASRAPSSLAAVAADLSAAKEKSPAALAVVKHDAEETVLTVGDRTYRVRGLAKNTGYETLKVSLRFACGGAWHLDTLDLAQAKQRAAFVAAAAEETNVKPDVLKHDVGHVLLKLEELQEQRLRAQVAPSAPPPIAPELRTKAEAFLRDPNLWERIAEHAALCGIAGERGNVLVGYLGAVSRLLDRPLAIIIQSSSAAGKTTLMDAILAFVPPERRIKYSAMTGQSLFYMGSVDLRHKILAIVEEAGAEKASYALKLLQSEGELSIASTGKDPHTGRMESQEYHVEGPTMIFLTTTNHDTDEELQNRSLVLTVDESREQTERIHALQREARTEAGIARRAKRAELLALHRAAQTLLLPLPVFNPYADQLRFLADRLRMRRDHEKYLILIDALALLFQHQRERRTVAGRECIVATLDDIARANELAHDVLGRSLDDMPPQTRRLLGLVQRMEKERGGKAGQAGGWRRRDLRAFTGWGDTQLKIHLGRLVELEYVLAQRDPAHLQGLVYELLFDGDVAAERPHLSGLIDAEALRKPGYDANRSGSEANRSGGDAGAVGIRSAPGRGAVGAWSEWRKDRKRRRVRRFRIRGRKRAEKRTSGRPRRRGVIVTVARAMNTSEPVSLETAIARHVSHLHAIGCTSATLATRVWVLGLFRAWAGERGVTQLADLTPEVVARWQR